MKPMAPGDTARGFLLEHDEHGRCWLRAPHRPGYGRIRADWCGPEQARRLAGGRRQLLARAVGLAKHPHLRVLDATGGLGRDAHVLAALGAEVTLVERHPLIHALLADALREWRTAERPPLSLTLLHDDARRVMAEQGPWDVVYLDPMYPHRDKAALPGKEMQFFRELTEGDPDADALLAPARACALRRVVVKRPLPAPALDQHPADQSLRGTQARFDLYLRPPCAISV